MVLIAPTIFIFTLGTLHFSCTTLKWPCQGWRDSYTDLEHALKVGGMRLVPFTLYGALSNKPVLCPEHCWIQSIQKQTKNNHNIFVLPIKKVEKETQFSVQGLSYEGKTTSTHPKTSLFGFVIRKENQQTSVGIKVYSPGTPSYFMEYIFLSFQLTHWVFGDIWYVFCIVYQKPIFAPTMLIFQFKCRNRYTYYFSNFSFIPMYNADVSLTLLVNNGRFYMPA